MKKLPITLFLFTICLTLLAFQCEEDEASLTQEEERIELDADKQEILDFAATSVCNESTECKYIALGSKPCGGPWSYLIYTTSIDTEKLELWVEDYNKKETAFNTKWSVFSDCSFVNPPTSISCENNVCVPVF